MKVSLSSCVSHRTFVGVKSLELKAVHPSVLFKDSMISVREAPSNNVIHQDFYSDMNPHRLTRASKTSSMLLQKKFSKGPEGMLKVLSRKSCYQQQSSTSAEKQNTRIRTVYN